MARGGQVAGSIGNSFALVTSSINVLFLALVGSTLGGICRAALYRYAMTGYTGYFDPAIMGNALRPK
jgi:hypothetical protein